MKNIKAFEDFGTQQIGEGENHHENYMFFQNLRTVKDAIEDILSMDKQKVDQMLSNGHDWALDHISTSTDDIEEVYHFLKGRMEMEDEGGEEQYTQTSPMNIEIIGTDDESEEEDGEDGDEE